MGQIISYLVPRIRPKLDAQVNMVTQGGDSDK